MEAGSRAREVEGTSVQVVAERTFLWQFLPEVEPTASCRLAAAHSHALRLGGLGVGCGFPRKVRTAEHGTTSPGAGCINALKFKGDVLMMLMLGCLWLCSSVSCSQRITASVLLFVEQGYVAKSA